MGRPVGVYSRGEAPCYNRLSRPLYKGYDSTKKTIFQSLDGSCDLSHAYHLRRARLYYGITVKGLREPECYKQFLNPSLTQHKDIMRADFERASREQIGALPISIRMATFIDEDISSSPVDNIRSDVGPEGKKGKQCIICKTIVDKGLKIVEIPASTRHVSFVAFEVTHPEDQVRRIIPSKVGSSGYCYPMLSQYPRRILM